jgi:hypothetical protein
MTSWVPFDLLDHLWQSTLFTAGCGWSRAPLRTNAARVRYWLWLGRVDEVPDSALDAGVVRRAFAWRTAAIAPPPAVSSVIEQVLTAAAGVNRRDACPRRTAHRFNAGRSLLAPGDRCRVGLAQWWRQWRPIRRRSVTRGRSTSARHMDLTGARIRAR